ncbi:glycosyltransferase family 2 protein [Caldibacillus thermoamylovorans]
MGINISVLINTFNEEKNIRNCLESVKWADEIIIVDMYSNDRTVEIAREYTDKIYMHERMGYVEPARQFALEKASNEWVLVVDADEMVPIELRNKLIEIAQSGEYDAVLIPRINYFFGHKMRGTGWGPLQDMQVRFFKKKYMKYGTRIHEFSNLDPSARVYKLKDKSVGFIHFNYIDVEHFLEKLNRYTTIEAKNAVDAGEKFSIAKLLLIMFKEFINRFIRKKGYVDGFQGFALSMLMMTYRLSAGLKHYLVERYSSVQTRQKILNEYSRIASDQLAKYVDEEDVKIEKKISS